jgi:hypothetical protein
VDGTDQPKPEPKPVTTTQEILYAKGDVADKVGMTTQGLANRAGRDPDFPLPTYTNESGTVQLYTKKDIQAIIEHLSRPEKDRLAKLAAALKSL